MPMPAPVRAQDDLRFVAMLGEWREVEWRSPGTGVVELPALHHR